MSYRATLHASRPQPASAALPMNALRNGLRAPDAESRIVQARPGHNFADVRIHAELGEPTAPQAAESSVETPEDGATELQGGTAACPTTARFASTVAGSQKANCQVPQGLFGASKLAHFTLSPQPQGTVTVTEQFTALDDPYNAIGLLTPNTFQAGAAGFDDCYMLASKQPLPVDFRLQVEQNHLLGGNILSKNKITYTGKDVRFCAHERKPRSCDFGARCR